MNPFLGIVLHALGGLCAGSFYIPFKRIKGWSWESYWLVQGLLAWIVMPPLVAFLTIPDLPRVFTQLSVWDLLGPYIFGVLWGIGGLTFGLSMRYLGMSLGYAIALGCCAALGTIATATFDGKLIEMFTITSGQIVLGGVIVCLVGIAICGYAGIRKESELTDEQKKQTIKEFALMKGFAVAVFAGALSACMAFAISAGESISEAALESGSPDIYQNFPIFIVCMAGGFTTNLIWCLILNFKNKSLGDYNSGRGGSLIGNYFFAGLAGIIWYGQFFFYGMGTTQMGQYDFSSWSIHMAFIIVFSNIWGIYFHEWKGVTNKTWRFIRGGIVILILSTIIVGMGNKIAG